MGGGWNGLGIKNLWRENGLGFSGSVGWETNEKNLWWPKKIQQKKNETEVWKLEGNNGFFSASRVREKGAERAWNSGSVLFLWCCATLCCFIHKNNHLISNRQKKKKQHILFESSLKVKTISFW